eukprot:1338335-Amorphochlora_amoeboformis.AAC.1
MPPSDNTKNTKYKLENKRIVFRSTEKKNGRKKVSIETNCSQSKWTAEALDSITDIYHQISTEFELNCEFCGYNLAQGGKESGKGGGRREKKTITKILEAYDARGVYTSPDLGNIGFILLVGLAGRDDE